MTRLASERLLISSVKRSYKVAELDPKRVADQFFLRARLEGIATELAVPNMTATQIDELETLAKMMERDIETGGNENYIVRNYNFHFSIYAASQNEELFWSIETPVGADRPLPRAGGAQPDHARGMAGAAQRDRPGNPRAQRRKGRAPDRKRHQLGRVDLRLAHRQ